MLIRQANQKRVKIVNIGSFYIKGLGFNQMSAIGIMMY